MEGSIDFDDQQLSDLQETRDILYQNMARGSGLFYLEKERAKMKKSFHHAFEYKLSTSLIVVGSSAEQAFSLIRSVLESYSHISELVLIKPDADKYTKRKNYTARVCGSLLFNDHEALIDMANQFMIRNEKDTNLNLALEDLEEHFKQCRMDGIPAVIVLEDFHVFAKRKRQTLIYTLLDLMHKKEMLFMIVGVTDHADVDTKLEKRVLSRLNAQYVFMPTPMGQHISEYLHNVFTIPSSAIIDDDDSNNAAVVTARNGTGSNGKRSKQRTTPRRSCRTATSPMIAEDEDIYEEFNHGPIDCTSSACISQTYALAFNQRVAEFFGRYETKESVPVSPTTARTGTIYTREEVDDAGCGEIKEEDGMIEVEQEEGNGSSNGGEKAFSFVSGSLLPLLQMHREWGRDIEFFGRVALKAITLLSPAHPFLSTELFHTAFASMEPRSVQETLHELTMLELHLLVSVLHIHGRGQVHNSSSSNSGAGTGTGSSSAAAAAAPVVATTRPVVMQVGPVLQICDMLMDVFRTNSIPKCRIIEALCNLAQRDLIFMVNATPGRTIFPVGSISLGKGVGSGSGVGDGIGGGSSGSSNSITEQTLLMLTLPYGEAKDAFRVQYTSNHQEQKSVPVSAAAAALSVNEGILPLQRQQQQQQQLHYRGRVPAPLVVPERVRRAVLEPREPLTYRALHNEDGGGGSAGASLTSGLSLTTHQALVGNYKQQQQQQQL